MSDYHIREISLDLKTVNLVFHIPISVGNNVIGVAWRTALVSHLGGTDVITSVLLDIQEAELTAMKAGEIYENVNTVRFSSLNLTDNQRLAEIEAAYVTAQTSVLTDAQIRLNYYGYVGDI